MSFLLLLRVVWPYLCEAGLCLGLKLIGNLIEKFPVRRQSCYSRHRFNLIEILLKRISSGKWEVRCNSDSIMLTAVNSMFSNTMYFVLLKLGFILNTNQYVFARAVSKQPLERNRRGRRSAREQHRFFPRTFCCVSFNNILQFNLLKSFSKFVFFFTRRFCRRQTGEFLDFSFNRGLHWSLNSQQLRLHRIATLIFKLPSSAA